MHAQEHHTEGTSMHACILTWVESRAQFVRRVSDRKCRNLAPFIPLRRRVPVSTPSDAGHQPCGLTNHGKVGQDGV
jgi:hypothetical protein